MRCLACRKLVVRKKARGRVPVYCNLRCVQMARRLRSLCKYTDVMPDILLLPLASWQRAMWATMRENERA